MLLNKFSRILIHDGLKVRVTPFHVRLIEALASVYPSPRMPETLFGALWPDADGIDCDNTFGVQVCKLRRLIADAGLPPLIWTRHMLIGLEMPVDMIGEQPDIIPSDLGPLLRELLWSHPNKRGADRILSVLP